MTWPFVESEFEKSKVLGWAIPVAACVAYPYLPGLLDSLVLVSGAIASGLLLMRRRRSWWWQDLVVLGWCLVPIGFIRVEAIVFEQRVRAHLPEFEIAGRGLLTGKLESCWGPIPSPTDCERERLPPNVRNMVIGVQKDRESVTFFFKEGTRRALTYAPLRSPSQSTPSGTIAPGWFLRSS